MFVISALRFYSERQYTSHRGHALLLFTVGRSLPHPLLLWDESFGSRLKRICSLDEAERDSARFAQRGEAPKCAFQVNRFL